MAAEDGGVILTWNVANWITIVLMAAVGFAILGLGQKIWQQRTAKSAAQPA
jgi:hypothetical protein